MTERKLAVVLLSGGLDSCVAAAVARRDFELALFHADYGQRTERRELRAFREQAVFFQTRHLLEVDLNFLGALGGSSLTDHSLPVPEGDGEPPGLPPTYVPFRNTVLIAAAVAWAEVNGAVAIFIGANEIDSPGYPDCRPEYYEAYNRLITLGTGPDTHIHLVVMTDQPSSSLDPSAHHVPGQKSRTAKMGLDATVCWDTPAGPRDPDAYKRV